MKKENVNEIEVKEVEVINAEMMQEEIDRKTAELEKCLKVLEFKKELSKNRKTFIQTLDQLQNAEDCLAQEPGFDSEQYKMKFVEAGYRENEVFSLGNRDIIMEFIQFIRVRIHRKIEEIETQLIG